MYMLSEDPVEAAELLANKHLLGQILFVSRVIGTVIKQVTSLPDDQLNSPWLLWAEKKPDNLNWLQLHLRGLLKEYDRRFKDATSKHLKARTLASIESKSTGLSITTAPRLYAENIENPIQGYRKMYNKVLESGDFVYTDKQNKQCFLRNVDETFYAL